MDVTRLSKKKKGLAHKVVERIAELYKIEKEFKEQNASVQFVYTTRQTKAEPILNSIKALNVSPITLEQCRSMPELIFPDKGEV